MNTKGISPLIATVLIIGFTVALAAIIITWGGRFIQETTEDVDLQTKIGLSCAKLDFKINSVDCQGSGAFDEVTTRVILVNDADVQIDEMLLRITGVNDVGDEQILVDELTLGGIAPFDAEEGVFNSVEAGGWSITPVVYLAKIEAIAEIVVEGTVATCDNVIEDFVPLDDDNCGIDYDYTL